MRGSSEGERLVPSAQEVGGVANSKLGALGTSGKQRSKYPPRWRDNCPRCQTSSGQIPIGLYRRRQQKWSPEAGAGWLGSCWLSAGWVVPRTCFIADSHDMVGHMR